MTSNTPTQVKGELNYVYEDHYLSAVKFWAAEFKCGRTNLGDESSGRPKTATNGPFSKKVITIVILLLLVQFRRNQSEIWSLIIITDKTRIYHYTPERKIQSKQ